MNTFTVGPDYIHFLDGTELQCDFHVENEVSVKEPGQRSLCLVIIVWGKKECMISSLVNSGKKPPFALP